MHEDAAEPAEYKMLASPKKHGTRQPVIKLTASSATSNSPVARALFQLETQGAPHAQNAQSPDQSHAPAAQTDSALFRAQVAESCVRHSTSLTC